jgi:hypothetical protein
MPSPIAGSLFADGDVLFQIHVDRLVVAELADQRVDRSPSTAKRPAKLRPEPDETNTGLFSARFGSGREATPNEI